MIKINVEGLQNNITKLNSLISKYEEIQRNLFNQLKDSTLNWHDGHSIEFENQIYLEKNESELFLLSLKNKKNVYEYIYSRYKDIGNNISCNLENKDMVLDCINESINMVEKVVNQFNKIDDSFQYKEKDKILRQKEKIKNLIDKLNNIKRDILNFYKEIQNIEDKVKAEINELEQIKINSFDYNLI